MGKNYEKWLSALLCAVMLLSLCACGTVSEPAATAEEKTFIKGILTADVAVSSDCEDTSFIVRIDVVKNGVAYNPREDITSLSYQLGDYTPRREGDAAL